jgi:hypothetical protein
MTESAFRHWPQLGYSTAHAYVSENKLLKYELTTKVLIVPFQRHGAPGHLGYFCYSHVRNARVMSHELMDVRKQDQPKINSTSRP